MEIIRETSIIPVKTKMTDIRRHRNGKSIYHNYYNNCDKDEEIFVVYGEESVLLWEDDNGILRGYFYTTNLQELVEMMPLWPKGCVIDYLTKSAGEIREFLEQHGLSFVAEMHRLSYANQTEADRERVAQNLALMEKTLYRPQNAHCAQMDELNVIYEKLYEVFDARESHLPTKEELARLINMRWVVVYYENDQLLGFNMFTVEHDQYYGYQIWNGTGPEGYFTLVKAAEQLYAEYREKEKTMHPVGKIKPTYFWINSKNKKQIRLSNFWGAKFDGLYDYVYEKV